MRALLSTVAVVVTGLALGGCPNRQQQPLPGPKSATVSGLVLPAPSQLGAPAAAASQRRDSPDEINWFQGTLEEAFTRRPSIEDRPQFRY
ncbi:MAG TPA: hypothetical protein VGI91_06540 [Steroidobacteraceae bacterium]|jgi:hypothetical protein